MWIVKVEGVDIFSQQRRYYPYHGLHNNDRYQANDIFFCYLLVNQRLLKRILPLSGLTISYLRIFPELFYGKQGSAQSSGQKFPCC